MRRSGRILLLISGGLLLLLIGGRAAVELYTEVLWYGTQGYLPVYWTRLGATLGVRLVAGGIAAGLVLLNLWIVARRLGPVQLRRQYGNLEISEQVPRTLVSGAIVITSILAGWWLSGLKFGGDDALALLAWLRQVDWGVEDPLFGRDLSFYIFSLPIYFRAVDYLLLAALWSIVLVLLGHVLVRMIRWREGRLEVEEEARLHFIVLAAAVVFLLGLRYWLGRYGLLLEGTGIGGGLGYTDVNARLPAHRALAVLSMIAGGALLYGASRRSWLPPALGLGVLGLAALLIGQLYPAFVQKFQVEPNQFAREAPYIRWNIDYTRRAYDLHRLKRRNFSYRPMAVSGWETLAPALSGLPLWEPEPLEMTYNQVEAIFGYYHFPNVDYDRYGPRTELQQVAIAVREFKLDGLPESARTWQTLRLNPKYVRGMGVVVSPATASGTGGEPVRWIRNVDPVVRDPGALAELDLRQPGIYFGETLGADGAQEYVILVPGRDSAYLGVPGTDFPAGIQLSSFPRLLAFAWRFHDKNLLFSGELTENSRFLFRRSLLERVGELAPFLWWDRDAYPVISSGRIIWIVDGYVASPTFPLARRLEIPGPGVVRYLRNSVKATVDAVTGEVAFYQVDDADPVIETYRRIFPGLIRPLSSMPEELRDHLRYPVLFLRAQAEILREYHLERPEAFFAGNDVWQLPLDFGRQEERPYHPSYAVMRLPGETRPEFLLSVPFIARERQNMTALLLARNDPPHYGELILLELPRDQQIPGPGQVATLMEQDPVISPQLTLWRQAGSDVQLGQLRVVPLDSTFLYVQPIFLSARERSIPELARIVVSDGRSVGMAPTLAEAVRAIWSTPAVGAPERGHPAPAILPAPGEWPQRALELLEQAERRLRTGDWAGFGDSWNELRTLLRGAGRKNP